MVSTHLKSVREIGSFPQVKAENEKFLKAPPSYYPCYTTLCVCAPHLHIWLLHGHHVEVSPPKVGKVPAVPAKAPGATNFAQRKSLVMITCYQISRQKSSQDKTHFMIHDRYTTAKCNVFLEFSHKSQSCWVFGVSKMPTFGMPYPKIWAKMLPPSPHQLRAAYKAAQRFQEQILSPLLDPRINISLDLPNGWQVCVLNGRDIQIFSVFLL